MAASSQKECTNYCKEEIEFFHKDVYYKREGDTRSWFEKDRSKIIHSNAFRRLQGKTQVFGPGTTDFFRTRLTHCLEASQIGKGIALNTKVADTDLVELACLTHDIGHPPFGHAGELELKKIMKEHGGFEGNAQNLRIINFLESKFDKCHGLNFTRASVDSILKYNKKYSKEKKSSIPIAKWKFYYDDDETLVEWAKEGAPNKETKSIECEIMNWADDVAYSTHDLEDGIKSGMISHDKLARLEPTIRDELKVENNWKEELWQPVKDIVRQLSSIPGTPHLIKAKRTELIASQITEFVKNTKVVQRENYDKYATRYHYHLEIDQDIQTKCEMLKKLVWKMILDDERVATLEKKGQIIISELFNLFNEKDEQNVKMLPSDFREMLEHGKIPRERVICDYIAGMTDNYALRLYSRLKESDIHSVFEIL